MNPSLLVNSHLLVPRESHVVASYVCKGINFPVVRFEVGSCSNQKSPVRKPSFPRTSPTMLDS